MSRLDDYKNKYGGAGGALDALRKKYGTQSTGADEKRGLSSSEETLANLRAKYGAMANTRTQEKKQDEKTRDPFTMDGTGWRADYETKVIPNPLSMLKQTSPTKPTDLVEGKLTSVGAQVANKQADDRIGQARQDARNPSDEYIRAEGLLQSVQHMRTMGHTEEDIERTVANAGYDGVAALESYVKSGGGYAVQNAKADRGETAQVYYELEGRKAVGDIRLAGGVAVDKFNTAVELGVRIAELNQALKYVSGENASDLIAERSQLIKAQAPYLEQLKKSGYDAERAVEYEVRQVREKAAAEQAKANQEWAKDNKALAILGSIATAPVQGFDIAHAAVSSIGKSDTSDPERYVPLSPSDMQVTGLTQDLREGASSDWSPTAKFLFNTGMSMVDSALLAYTIGPAAGVVLGMNAASSSAKEALERGATNGQAITIGFASGAAEMLFEKISIESLLSVKEVKQAKTILGNALRQAGTEASEELLTEVSNILVDAAVMGENSNFKKAVAAYMDAGMSEEAAKKKAYLDNLAQVGMAALGGALSGGVMGGSASTVSYAYNKAYQNYLSKNLNENQINTLSVAQEFAQGSETRKLADDISAAIDAAASNDKKVEISADQWGRLMKSMEAERDQHGPADPGAVDKVLHPKEATLSTTAKALIDAGAEPKTANTKGALLDRLRSGDSSLSNEELRALDLNSPATRAVFKSLMGVELPGRTESHILHRAALDAARGVVAQREAQQAAQQQEAMAAQVEQAKQQAVNEAVQDAAVRGSEAEKNLEAEVARMVQEKTAQMSEPTQTAEQQSPAQEVQNTAQETQNPSTEPTATAEQRASVGEVSTQNSVAPEAIKTPQRGSAKSLLDYVNRVNQSDANVRQRTQETTVKVLNSNLKALGATATIEVKNLGKDGPAAQWNPDGRIELNADALNKDGGYRHASQHAIVYTLTHELFHEASSKQGGDSSQWTKKQANELIEFGKNMVGEEKWAARVESMRNAQISAMMRDGKTREQAEARLTEDYLNEELAADVLRDVFASQGKLNLFAKENRSTLTKIRDWLQKKFDALLGREDAGNRELVQEMNRIIKNVNEALTKTVERDTDKAETTTQEAKYSSGELTFDEENALLDYKSSRSYVINAKLRDRVELTQDEDDFVKNLDAALSKLPVFKGQVIRRLVFDSFGGRSELERFYEGHAAGTPVLYSAYTSASTSEEGYPVDGEFTAELRLSSMSGRDVDGFGNNMESEVIFPRGTVFIVEDASIKGGHVVITAREVELNERNHGQLYTEERSGPVREMREPQTVHPNVQSVPERNPDGSAVRSAQTHGAVPGGQRDSVRAEEGVTKKYSPAAIDYDKIVDPFYSQMERTIEGVKQEKLGASSVIPMLRGKGVKQEEIKWSGLEQFLEGKKSVTKQELLEFVKLNSIDLEEQTLDGHRETEYLQDQTTGEVYTDMEHMRGVIESMAEEMGYDPDEVRYDFNDFPDLGRIVAYVINPETGEDIDLTTVQGEFSDKSTRWEEYTTPGGDNYRELLYKMPESDYSNKAMRVHWGQSGEGSGVLAHARVQDFDAPGGQMLFIEEIQSDWHNAGQKSGYVTKDVESMQRELRDLRSKNVLNGEKTEAEVAREAELNKYLYPRNAELDAELDALKAQITTNPLIASALNKIAEVKFNGNLHYAENNLLSARTSLYTDDLHAAGVELTRFERDAVREFILKKEDWSQEFNEYTMNGGREAELANRAPEAPYSKNYHEYVLKRLLRMAAENGYDSIGWTTGKMQEERWSSEYAEGYRIEYDQDIPKFLRKYGKQWGAEVTKTRIPNGIDAEILAGQEDYLLRQIEQAENDAESYERNGWDSTDERNYAANLRKRLEDLRGPEVWTMRIPDQMRDDLLYKGQPRYSAPTLADTNTEEFRQWFNDDSGELTNPDGTPKVFLRGTIHSGSAKFRKGKGTVSGGLFFSTSLDAAKNYALHTGRDYEQQEPREFKHRVVDSWEEAVEFVKNDLRDEFELTFEDGKWHFRVFQPDFGLDMAQRPIMTRVVDNDEGFVANAAGLDEFNDYYEADLKSWDEVEEWAKENFNEGFEMYKEEPEDIKIPGTSMVFKSKLPAKWFVIERAGKWADAGTYANTAKGLERFNKTYSDAIQQNHPRNPGWSQYYLTATKTLVVDAEGRDYRRVMKDKNGMWMYTDHVVQQAWKDGYDCVVIKNVLDGDKKMEFDEFDNFGATEELMTDYIVKDPGQVKSIYNTGSFDRNNPDVRYSPNTDYQTGGNTGNVNPETGFRRGSVADSFMRIWNTGAQDEAINTLEYILTRLAELEAEAQERNLRDLRAAVLKPRVTEEIAERNRRHIERLIERYGMIPQTSGAQQEVRLPEQIDDKTYVAGATQTIMAHEVTNELLGDELVQDILAGNAGVTYARIGDRETLKQVDDEFERQGVDGFLRQWKNKVNSGEGMTKLDIARAEKLYVELAGAKEFTDESIRDILNLVAEISAAGTQAGQTVQAMTLLKKMTPTGQLYYIQKAVDRLNRSPNQKSPIVINEQLAKQLAEAKTISEINAAVDAIITDIAQQVPVSLADKWNTWRYFAMLGNPRTHIRNLLGNAIFAPARLVKNVIGTGLERAILRGEKADQRTKSIVVSKELRNFAEQDAEEMKDILRGGGKYNTSDMIRDKRVIFKKAPWLNTATQKNSEFLEKEDWIFLRSSYQSALAGFLSARGITDVNDLLDTNEGRKTLNEAREYAVREAQRATYRDASKLASMLNTGKRNLPKPLSWLLEGIVPFTKTPVNIVKRGFEYSPLGIVKTIYDAANRGVAKAQRAQGKTVKRDLLSAADVIDELAANLTGTGVALLGVLLSRLGLLTAGLGEDDEDKFKELYGDQAYSLNIPGVGSYTIDWMAPVALPLFVGAEIYNTIAEDYGDLTPSEIVDAIADGMTTILEPMLSLSMLDGVNEALSANKFGDSEDAIWNVLSAALGSYVSQGVPTALGQMARTIDPNRRTTFTEKGEGKVNAQLQRFWQSSVQGKVPVYQNDKLAYVDAWGRTDTTGSVLLRAFENFLSPGYINSSRKTGVEAELERLAAAEKDTSVMPDRAAKYFSVNKETYAMSKDEYEAHLIDRGQTSYRLVSDFINDPVYQLMSDKDRVAVINDIYEYAKQTACYHTNSEYVRKDWVEDVDAYVRNGGDEVDYITMRHSAENSKPSEAAYGRDDLTFAEMSTLVIGDTGSTQRAPKEFADPGRSGYEYVMDAEQQAHYTEMWDSEFGKQFDKLFSSRKYQNASAEERKELVAELRADVTAEVKKDMERWLRQRGVKASKK